MSLPMNSICAQCLMGKHVNNARNIGGEAVATAFAKGIMEAFLRLPPDADSSLIGADISDLYVNLCGLSRDRFVQEKLQSNAFVLERLERIREKVNSAPDRLYAALQFAVLGNYLDFAALFGKVSFEDLDKMLLDAHSLDLTGAGYDKLRKDLETAKTLLIITDNAGEIVFDRILAETLQDLYPDLSITFLVRGGPANNDATREDAQAVGITFPVVDSGVGIGGTPLSVVSPEARCAVETSDIVIAKGMGNTESMYGCGHNVFYAFLVKCARFEQFFQKPHLTPMFVFDGQYPL